jgi:hypothetical protein
MAESLSFGFAGVYWRESPENSGFVQDNKTIGVALALSRRVWMVVTQTVSLRER